MTVEQEIRNTYESQGFLVQGVTRLDDGTFDVEFLTEAGVSIRNVVFCVVMRHAYQCQRQNPVPNN